jgi:hypothetical protein
MVVHRLRQIFRISGQPERARGPIVPRNSMRFFTTAISRWLFAGSAAAVPPRSAEYRCTRQRARIGQKGQPLTVDVLVSVQLCATEPTVRLFACCRRQRQLSRLAVGMSSEASTGRAGRRDRAQRCRSLRYVVRERADLYSRRSSSTFPHNEFRLELVLLDRLIAVIVDLRQQVLST